MTTFKYKSSRRLSRKELAERLIGAATILQEETDDDLMGFVGVAGSFWEVSGLKKERQKREIDNGDNT
jgi:membrane protein implicated in regulation of membrane protease activity